MRNPIVVFFVIVLVGILGLFIGALFLGLEGYLGSIFAIAAAGAFIVSAIYNNSSK